MDTTRKPASNAVFAVMGATGTGKSTFIRLLANDDLIRIGHNQDSETFEIQTADYTDQATGRHVVLIDTPGFDDSRAGVTDTDILQKIVEYLEPEEGKSRKLNGIIYMHRISDPRVGGVSRKNLRMFRSLCGEKTLPNVRIVTTNWSRVTEEEGCYREADLTNGAFKPLIDAGAHMCRYADTVESAYNIMSELLPLEAAAIMIQEEVQRGMTLAETGAGKVLTADLRLLQKKHERAMADLKKEMEAAAKERDQALRAEFEHEFKALEEKIKRVEVDRAKLEKTVEELREAGRKRRAEEKAELERRMGQWADERRALSAEVTAARENVIRLENDAAKRQGELERQIADTNRTVAELAARERNNLGVDATGSDASSRRSRVGSSGTSTESQRNQESERNDVEADATERDASPQRSRGGSFGAHTIPQRNPDSSGTRRESQEALVDINSEYARMEAEMEALQAKIHEAEDNRLWRSLHRLPLFSLWR